MANVLGRDQLWSQRIYNWNVQCHLVSSSNVKVLVDDAADWSRSFIGYSSANYALSEVRDPVKTIKIAAPLAMCFVAFVYLSVNVAYFAVVSKTDMLHGGTIPA